MGRVIVADARDITDGAMHSFAQKVETGIPILLISRPEGFVFNAAVLELAGKPYVVWDVMEMGWDAAIPYTCFFGFNQFSFFSPNRFPQFKDDFNEWGKLNDFVSKNQPIKYFKRELLTKEADDHYLPLAYPCLYDIPPVQSKEAFDNRILQVGYTWGLSHEGRKKLHANIWRESGQYGYVVCDNISNLSAFCQFEDNSKKWLTQNVPHYVRYPMVSTKESVGINDIIGNCKIALSPAGAGRVCFRHTEVSMNSVMLMWEDDIKWSFDWVHGRNCIKAQEGEEIEAIVEALDNPTLHDIYKAGVETCRQYHIDNYKKHIENLINNA